MCAVATAAAAVCETKKLQYNITIIFCFLFYNCIFMLFKIHKALPACQWDSHAPPKSLKLYYFNWRFVAGRCLTVFAHWFALISFYFIIDYDLLDADTSTRKHRITIFGSMEWHSQTWAEPDFVMHFLGTVNNRITLITFTDPHFHHFFT